jgi:hypothetical protein
MVAAKYHSNIHLNESQQANEYLILFRNNISSFHSDIDAVLRKFYQVSR